MTQDMTHCMNKDMVQSLVMKARTMLILLVLILTGGNTAAQVKVHGNVYGGGNLADVKENTAVNMSAGQVYGNVYGGGKGKADNFKCDKAMVGEEKQENACADPASNDNKDKGTIVTISNGTVGTLEGEEGSQTLKEGTGNVYGGGEIGRVEWNTQVRIGVGTEGGTFAPVIYGSVFGAGKGLETHGYSALVRGNSTVTIQGNAKVGYNVYGGGEMSTVGRYWVKGIPITYTCDGETVPTAPEDLPDEMPYKTRRGGKITVTVQGKAQIGPDNGATETAGHVFGAGKGVTPNYVHTGDKGNWSRRMVDYKSTKHTGEPGTTWDYYPDDHNYVWEYFATEDKYLEFLQTLALVTGTDVTINGATVKGNVYGGSESGFVQDDTDVKILGGTIGTADSYGNVFGGGKGLVEFSEAGLVKGNATVAVSDGTIQRNVYGGGELGHVGTFAETSDGRYVKKKDKNGVDMNTGLCTVSITGGKIGPDNNSNQEIGNVFGAGKGKDDTFKCEKAMTMETSVSVGGGTVNGNVYGGGEVGRVEYDTEVTIGRKTNETTKGSGTGTPIINGSVFGAGRGVATHGYSALVRGNTQVDVEGGARATVSGSVFGGGEIASVGRYGLNTENMPNILLGGGTCVVNVLGSVVITGDVFGAGQGVDPSTFNKTGSDKTKLSRRMTVYTNSSEFKDDYTTKTGNTWEYYDENVTPKIVWEYYQNAGAYSDYLQTLALATAPNVTIDGNAQVKGSVFGGGELGLTKGSVTVTIKNGTIGTLDTSGNPVVGTGDVYGGGSLANTNTTHYVGLKNDDESPKYAEEEVDGKTIKYIETKEVHPTTIVRLIGGEVYGDAYGGGLGRLASDDVSEVEAVVVGDVLVDLNGTTTVATDADGGRTWTANTGEAIRPEEKGCIVRRVFGCNNLNGTPQKNVTVHVYATQNAEATQIANTPAVEASGDDPAVPAVENAKVLGRYDVEAVYGGGNEAAYIPETPNTSTTATPNGSKSQVIIDGCDYTSIETVYGGGNAAPVPESNVEIRAAYEIGYVFGGGNGKDKKSDGSENPGADIGQKSDGTPYGTGNANSTLEGGLIHEAYGGSNQKGVIKGSINQKSNPDASDCELDLRKVVGAGKYADIDQDVNMILSCQPENKVEVLFAGADEANVNGNITLTITNGNFGQVFGGNNLGGAVKGRIIVNVEETGCRPINIDELYLCGNNAAYSVYGYYQSDEVHPVTGKKILKPRESSDDSHKPVKDYNRENDSWTVYSGEGGDTFTPYADPVLNVISCTHIGQVFGGGYGTGAFIYGNPTVNINMIQGDHYTNIPETADNPNRLGEIGTVYGGGNAADVYGNTTVNIGTEPTVDLVSTEETGKTVLGAYISGNVYGGGKGEAKMEAGTAGEAFLCAKAMVRGDEGTYVNIGNGMVRGNVYGGGEVGRVEHNTAVTIGLTSGTSTPVINGSVFGAGAGVNTHGYSALVRGNSTVIVQADAKVRGSVYGGGEKASVGKYEVKNGLPVALAPDDIHPNSGYCYVYVRGNAEIGPDNMKMDKVDDNGDPLLDDDGNPLPPDDTGYVFGGGKGVLPYEGYNDTTQPFHMNGTQHKDGEGEWDGKSWDDAPTHYDSYNDCYNNHAGELQTSYINFIKSLALATQTDVMIEGNAFVKGGVYGGSENGYVQHDTHVTIQGNCQIGNGHILLKDEDGKIIANRGLNRPYTADEWATGHLSATDADFTTEELAAELKTKVNARFANSLPECASWPYGEEITVDGKKMMIYAPYDKYAMTTTGNEEKYSNGKITAGGRRRGSDGHTFFGNVFGGGSGYFPYRPGYWFESAGAVYGQTTIDINGGHILTNVYGGNEMTDVGEGLSGEGTAGKCIVNMEDGTLGVPRTLDEIDAHPVTCYLFGAGKGDQRVFFNKSTNVKDVEININGTARIYGSVFGGGEDGHVQKDVNITISSAGSTKTEGGKEIQYPYIGTWGTSYVDGNIFGAGRGFGGDAYTAGNVAGSVDVDIKGGTILGSIYGGGRLGSVGYGLYSSDAGGTYYGAMRPDNTGDDDNNTAISNFKRGYVEIEISGGTIGNDHEYIIPDATNIEEAGISETDISKWNDTNKYWTKWKNYHHVPKTDYDPSTGRLTHTKGGNVFTGGMGRQTQLDGKTLITAIDWWRLGSVKSTKLTISGDAIIKSNVYGGGELGAVIPAKGTTEGGSTEIEIQGGTIGQLIGTGDSQYTFGSVFGGGMGSEMDTSSEDKIGGRVDGSTKITMTGGTVMASVYGGGELAVVKGSHTAKGHEDEDMSVGTEINISGTVSEGIYSTIIGYNKSGFGGATMGNVYGGGKGSLTTANAGLIKNNTLINISGSPAIYHNIYGGGAYGSVGTFTFTTDKPTGWTDGTGKTEVIITGGNIGTDGRENGMVFGSSRGDVGTPTGNPAVDPNDRLAWTYDTHVVIGTKSSSTGPQISGSVYGSGENGHVYHDTDVEIHSGVVGILTGGKVTIDGIEYEGADNPYRGNVYGGGCGTDTYTVEGKKYYNPLAGIVLGNATVEMDGGHVVRTVYGGGAMGSVGTFTYDPDGKPTDCPNASSVDPATGEISDGTGLCSVTISGGIIGPETMAMPNNYGNVFGAGRGELHDPAVYPNLETSAYFNNTLVTIKEDAFVKGSVYGGSESGHVLNDTWVKIQGGQIGCGKNTENPYSDESKWTTNADPSNFAECVSWEFKSPWTPYDKFANENGKYPDGSDADNARNVGTDGHTFYGNVFGGGSGYTPYAPGKWLPTAGWVEGNTKVEITGGHILTSVYGGCEMSDVGAGGVRKMTDLTNSKPEMFYDITKTGGKCTVKMSGGTLGVPRTLAQIAAHPVTCYLFGAGKGDQRIFFNKTTNVKEVDVEISGGIIYGSVFGGGEDGHVMKDVNMTIKKHDGDDRTMDPWIGTWGTSYVEGNVFGGGRGFSGEALTAGNIGGCVTMNIEGGTMLGSVYGGGRLASVGYGLYLVDEEVDGVKPYGVMRGDDVDDRGREVSDFKRGYITINISGGTIGNNLEYIYNPSAPQKENIPNTVFDTKTNKLLYTKGGNVFAGAMGRLYALDNQTPLAEWKRLGRCKQTTLNISGGTIKSSVYGGGELGVVDQNTEVNITGGIIGTKVVDPNDATKSYYFGSVFGGGKGSNDDPTPNDEISETDKAEISNAGMVVGNATVKLNKGVANGKKGGIVHQIFGCNDMNSSPKGDVEVYVYATQTWSEDDGANISSKPGKNIKTYDVEAVYGGGNLAPYEPTDPDNKKAKVIIDGCGLTSIHQVYGGGNAASTPATEVTVKGTYEIEELFGGGNGFDDLPGGEPNPGANVGYKDYHLVENDPAFATKDARVSGGDFAQYRYGSGVAGVNVFGGLIHRVFGGSNTKGNVRQTALTLLEELKGDTDDPCCPFEVDEVYGGGKSAPMDAEAKLLMQCIPGLKVAYGGAEDADVQGDVTLNITNGRFNRIFGGNNISGTIRGAITINIEETGCKPIIIGELYGGGNLAGYSKYGYEEKEVSIIENGQTKQVKKWMPIEDPNHKEDGKEFADPQVNIKSFTSIGEVYGGGLGESAVMVGNPHVNINVAEGDHSDEEVPEGAKTYNTDEGLPIPSHASGAIGAIQNVYGGGNAAKVVGDTYVNIGREATVQYVTKSENETVPRDPVPVVGADIRGNVYGGGNEAEVTGRTNVTIGKSTTP